MADRGARQPAELDEARDGNAEGRGDEQRPEFRSGEAHTANERHRQYAQAGKENAIEHHVLDAHLVEREAAEVEARAPQATGHKAGAVAEKG